MVYSVYFEPSNSPALTSTLSVPAGPHTAWTKTRVMAPFGLPKFPLFTVEVSKARWPPRVFQLLFSYERLDISRCTEPRSSCIDRKGRRNIIFKLNETNTRTGTKKGDVKKSSASCWYRDTLACCYPGQEIIRPVESTENQ